MALESSQDLMNPGHWQPLHASAGLSRLGGDSEGLYLDDQGTPSVECREQDAPGRRAVTVARQDGARITHRLETPIRHFEHADLIHRTESILHAPEETKIPVWIAVQREDNIDHVLEALGSCDRAVLRDVANEQDRHGASFRRSDQPSRRLTDRSHAPGTAVSAVAGNGLDRIDNDDRVHAGSDEVTKVLHVGLRRDQKTICDGSGPSCPNADLWSRLFTRGNQYAQIGFGECRADFQDEG